MAAGAVADEVAVGADDRLRFAAPEVAVAGDLGSGRLADIGIHSLAQQARTTLRLGELCQFVRHGLEPSFQLTDRLQHSSLHGCSGNLNLVLVIGQWCGLRYRRRTHGIGEIFGHPLILQQ